MPSFIEALESRALLSTTSAATLTADRSSITSMVAQLPKDFAAEKQLILTDEKALAAALQGTAKSNGTLFKSLHVSTMNSFASIHFDDRQLLALAGKTEASIADGLEFLKRSSAKQSAKVNQDILVLGDGTRSGDATASPLGNLETDSRFGSAIQVLSNIVDSNPSNAAIQNAVGKTQIDLVGPGEPFGSAPMAGDGISLAFTIQNVKSTLLFL